MTFASPITLSLAFGPDGVTGTTGTARWHAPRPHDLYVQLSRDLEPGWVHLVIKGSTPLDKGQNAALGAASEQQARGVIGRVRQADGTLSGAMKRVSGLFSQSVAAGALLCRAEDLALASPGPAAQWDPYWPRDLALGLARMGGFAHSRSVVAETSARPGALPRLPPQRAAPMQGATGADHAHILVYGRIEASTSLYMEGLPADLQAHLRFLEPSDLVSDLDWLADADVVLITRGFEHALASGALDLLRELGTPIVWFTDDDFIALGSEDAALAWYSTEAVKRFCDQLQGIVVTSPALAERFRPFHPIIALAPIAADPRLFVRRPTPENRVGPAAVIGGRFRARSFTHHVAPAARAAAMPLALSRDLRAKAQGAQIMPFRADFSQFVFGWQTLAPRALLHPYGNTANIGSKSQGTILVGAYLGAIPVVGHEPAYANLSEDDGVLKAARDPAAWQAALRRMSDPETAAELWARLDRWVDRTCTPEGGRAWVESLLALAPASSGSRRDQRLSAALGSRAFKQAPPSRSDVGRGLQRLGRHLNRLDSPLKRR